MSRSTLNQSVRVKTEGILLVEFQLLILSSVNGKDILFCSTSLSKAFLLDKAAKIPSSNGLGSI